MSLANGDGAPLLLDRTTATEAATDALRSLILSGDIPGGSPLRQDDLAKRLGVSRTPLREALQRLTVEGLIRMDHHRGAVAAVPSIAELREIYDSEIWDSTQERVALKWVRISSSSRSASPVTSASTISPCSCWARVLLSPERATMLM